MIKVIWILLCISTGITSEGNDATLKTILQGMIKGKTMTSRNGRTFYGYHKIPYARPPLGDLRFTNPVPGENWSGILDGTNDGPICTQKNIFVKEKFYLLGEEDCVYLNVYTPQTNNDTSEPLPVMVWLHGGGWVTGSGNSHFYSPDHLMDKDIVFVSVSYRVGPMGFLSMEDDVLPGNWGLKDQSLALKWVQNNIRFFGGNPNCVTIFGESAGGSSVHYHMLSPMSRGLFHRAISQSGTALTSWSLGAPGVTRNNTIKIAELLGCPTAPTEALVNCMRNKPVEDIISQDVHFLEWFMDPMIPFKPVVEKLAKPGEAFIPEHPVASIIAGNVANVPWLTGLNSGDGALRVAGIFDKEERVQELEEKFNKIVPASLFYRDKADNVDDITRRIRNFYFGNKKIGNETYDQAVNLWTDGWFMEGEHRAVRLHQKYVKSPVYYYYFSYRGSLSYSAVFGDESRDFGVCHADELIYLFPAERHFPGHKYSNRDKKYIDIFLQLWTDFAKYGQPIPTNSTLNETWNSVHSEKLEYLHISEKGLHMEENLLPDRNSFWDNLRMNFKKEHDEL